MKRILNRHKQVTSLFRNQTNETTLASQLRKSSTATSAEYKGGPELILKSCYPSLEIPTENVSDYCLSKFDPAWDNLPALVCGESQKELTFKDVTDLSKRFGSQLLNDGLVPGDRIAVLVPNCPEFGPILYGATGVGVTVVPISPLLTPSELSKIFQLSKPKLLITFDPLIPLVQAAQSNPKEYPILTLSESSSSGCIPWEEYVANDGSLYENRPTFDPTTTLAILPFSSGTTGPPKGVMLTHQNLTSITALFNDRESGCGIIGSEEGQEQAVALSIIPMFHIFGLTCNAMQALTVGCKMVTLPRFEPLSFISTLAKYQPTDMNIVPPLVSFLALNPAITRDKHLSRTKMICSGGSPLSPQTVSQLKQKLWPSPCEIKEGYGLTEAVCGARTTKDFPEEKRGSIGRIFPNTEAKVVDIDNGTTLGVGQPGELCLKGPQVTIGYLDNKEATDQALDGSGWFHTGDVVTYDEHGYIYIVDRIKDMIKVKGYQVAPTEVEEVIRTVPGVLDVSVVGVKDEKLGEAPRAFIVLKDELKENNDDNFKKHINDFLADKLASFKQLSGGIVFMEELPKSPTGKVLRKELRNISV